MNNKQSFCPNLLFDNGVVSIGEFLTIEEAMNFPIKEVWCINRNDDNKFQAYKKQNTRILIICCWNKAIEDTTKFVVALLFTDGSIKYFDMNDLPLYPNEKKEQFLKSLGEDTLLFLNKISEKQTTSNGYIKTDECKISKQILECRINRIVKEVLNEMRFA